MVAEPARDEIPEWDGQSNTLERFEEDVLIFTHAVPKDRKVTHGPKLLQQFPTGLSTERNRLGTSEVRRVTTGERRISVPEWWKCGAQSRFGREEVDRCILEVLVVFNRPQECHLPIVVLLFPTIAYDVCVLCAQRVAHAPFEERHK